MLYPGFPLEQVLDPTGAGDSFAGAMMGYLASRGSARPSDVRRAILHGNVMGSFAVSGYGLDGLAGAGKREIAGRLREYERMMGHSKKT